METTSNAKHHRAVELKVPQEEFFGTRRPKKNAGPLQQEERRLGRYIAPEEYMHMQEATYVIFDRKFEYVDNKFSEIFRISPEEACGREFDPMVLVAPESRSAVWDNYRKGFRGEEKIQRYEFTGMTINGEKVECGTCVIFIPYKWGVAIHGMLHINGSVKRNIEKSQENTMDVYQL